MDVLLSPSISINEKGHLEISGCDTLSLAKEFGTPLYVLSEDEIRGASRKFSEAFQKFYNGNGKPIYASKAFCCLEVIRTVLSEGLDVEVVSGGELYTALKAGAKGEQIHFQGNNKTEEELKLALDNGVSDIVVDNLTELTRIQKMAKDLGISASISLRVTPGIEAHTHEFIRTGQVDSKFGLDLGSGEAMKAVELALSMKDIRLKGLHCHIGSQIMETEPFVRAAEVMLEFYREIRKAHPDFILSHLNLGGGFAVRYVEEDKTPPYDGYVRDVSSVIFRRCGEFSLPVPKIFIEPGRSIVGEAGITLYTVGNIKEIPGVRNYVAIDGGMYENPRYALYRSPYTCLIADRAGCPKDYTATIAGKCCESGDLIQENAAIQTPRIGDTLAVLSTGAYNYSMASNYNRNPRPACVMVSGGNARLILRRETYEDLLNCDI